MGQPHLVRQSPGAGPEKVALDREVLIGRGSDCTVALNDDLVSRHHARVSLAGRAAKVKDLGSTNGTTVAGTRITERSLADGETFTVGRTTFTFRAGDAGPAAPLEASTRRIQSDPAATAPGLVVTDSGDASVFEARSDLALDADRASHSTQALSLEQMAQLSRRLAALNKIGNALASILEVDHLLEEVVQAVLGLFPRADRCCVLLEDRGELRPAKVKGRGKSAADLSIRLSRTVLALNRDERKGVLSFDTASDQRLSAAVSIVASGIRSVMSVPILQKDDFYGILYVDTADFGSPFTSDDLQLLASLASQVAIFVKNARLVGQIEKETELRTNLGRYLSPSVVNEIQQGNLVPHLGGETREGTVLFSDIVGFTKVCRHLPAAEVVALLNRFFRESVDAVFRYDGTVDKFGGDAMLCVWGAPVAMADHATPAIAAALEMQVRLYGFNLENAGIEGRVPVRMGIGLNSGSFIAGNVGSERRLEYTVIGDAVNLAQRVEEKATGGMVLVSEATRRLSPGACAVRMKPTTIRGAQGEFQVFSVRAVPRPGDAKGSLLCAVPCRARRTGISTGADAMIVSLERRREGPIAVVRVPAAFAEACSEAVELDLLLPELPDLPPLGGGVMARRPAEAGRPWRDIELLVPVLPPALDALLRATGETPSSLAPDDIPRS